jgi:hypothetical protein
LKGVEIHFGRFDRACCGLRDGPVSIPRPGIGRIQIRQFQISMKFKKPVEPV